MDDVIVWIIIIGFYAPLHFLPPILLILFNTHTDERKQALVRAVVDCSASMVLAFVLVYFIGLDNMLLAMGILLGALFLPYVRVVKVMLENRRQA